jgi:DNA-binding transcriptional MerR regulator/quercetin dioxygenase-like cupin family protein
LIEEKHVPIRFQILNKADDPVRYKVTDVAHVIGVSASTLRLWELQGLIEPERTIGGQRCYTGAHLEQLRRIQRYRSEQGLNPAAIKAALEGEAEPKQSSTRSEPDQIGKRVRHLRQSAGRTLVDVAGVAGVAVSALSTFERTSQGISLKLLHEVAATLNTTVSALSGTSDAAQRKLIRAGEWPQWPQTTPGVVIQVMADGRNQMDCHRFVLAPGVSSEGAYEHEGEEFLHVLSGQLEIVLGADEFHQLNPGDSLYFKSSLRHAWKNSFNGETVLLWINTPPTF